ncbi:MAG: prolipoprotein diacylglyceryl transferase [Armatimonadetes bacterium]|nr:prolipoprotein diacylglyceryl transferase [Armatimonadota bacterium]MDW8122724.1 prolipoprotein diacylglyceryl transferase [Armatimonadota bacterium]
MQPILLQIGPLTIRAYGVFVVAGLLLGAWWAKEEFRRRGLTRELYEDVFIGVIIGGVIGARALFVILNWSRYEDSFWSVLTLWRDAGLSFHGAVAGAVLASLLICWRHKVSFWTVADAAAPAIPLGHAIGRVGCFLNGCCHGKPTFSFVGVSFENPEIGISTPPSHPTQLYEAFLLVGLFLLLVRLRSQMVSPGRLFLLWIGGYGMIRFFVDFWRANLNAGQFLGLSAAQWLSLALIVVSSFAFWKLPSRAVSPQQPFKKKRQDRTTAN